MQCPTDQTTLVMSERSGIEIDYCPQCRGVWLDRGELDKILERSAQIANPDNRSPYRDDDDEPRQPHRDETRPPSKRRSFREEILDFG
jgi:Zn-finger nucleic acid-binding protein